MTNQYLNEFQYTDDEMREIRALHRLNRNRDELIELDQQDQDLVCCFEAIGQSIIDSRKN